MRKAKIITSICTLVGVATPLTILSSCSTGGDKPGPQPGPTPPTPSVPEVKCISDKQFGVQDNTPVEIKFRFTGETGTKIDIKVGGTITHELTKVTSATVGSDGIFTIKIGFVQQPQKGWDQPFSLIFSFPDSQGTIVEQTIKGFDIFYNGVEPVYDNDVKLVGDSDKTIKDTYVTEFSFKLNQPLQDGETLSCQPSSIAGTNTLSVKIEQPAIGSEQTEFNVQVTIFKENGGEPYKNDNVNFNLVFKGLKDDVVTFTSTVEDLNIKYDTAVKNVPFDKLVIKDGVLRGLNCGWGDDSIKDCDTLYIPNNVVEVQWDQTVPGQLSNLAGSKINTIKFEEGTSPLFINQSVFTGLGDVSMLVLPKRLSYIAKYCFRSCNNLNCIDLRSWDEEKFNNTNPFGEPLSFDLNILTNGKFILSPENSASIDAYYTFSTLHKNFASWSGITKPSGTGKVADKFKYDEFGNQKIITGVSETISGNLEIPIWCNSIKPRAFSKPDSEETTLPNVTTITVAEGSIIEKIYAGAFAGIQATTIDLTKATNLKHVDNGAFNSANKLSRIELPNSVETISPNCFYKCSSLKDIDLSKTQITKISLGLFSSCTTLTNVILNNKITWVGAGAFYKCINLSTEFNLKNIAYVGSEAFSECSKVKIVFPTDDESQLSYLGEKAFYGSTISGNIYIPSSVKYICDGVFALNYGITDINVSLNNKNYYSKDGYLYSSNKGELLFACGNSGEIPEQVENVRPYAIAGIKYQGSELDLSKTHIKSIGDYAFYETKCTDENGFDLILPKSVESIGKGVFSCFNQSYCTIKSINLGDLGNLKSIGSECFKQAKKLTDIIIPSSIETIPSQCFHYSGLKRITIPKTIKSIALYAFQGCTFEWIDVSDYDTVPSWGTSIFMNYGSSKVTVKIKDESLSSAWISTLKNAGLSENLINIEVVK